LKVISGSCIHFFRVQCTDR